MSEVVAVKTKKKGTPKTEAIIGTGVNRLEQANKAITDALKQFDNLPANLAKLTAEIADKEQKVSELSTEYTEKRRAFEVQFDLNAKAHEERYVTGWLESRFKMAVTVAEWEGLKRELDELKQNAKQELNAAVGSAVNAQRRENESELKVREAQYTAKEAENKAQIASLTSQNVALQKEVLSWQTALNEERKASVERAKAGSIGAINLGNQGTSR